MLSSRLVGLRRLDFLVGLCFLVSLTLAEDSPVLDVPISVSFNGRDVRMHNLFLSSANCEFDGSELPSPIMLPSYRNETRTCTLTPKDLEMLHILLNETQSLNVAVRPIDPFAEASAEMRCSLRWPAAPALAARGLRPTGLVVMISWARQSAGAPAAGHAPPGAPAAPRTHNITVTGCSASLRHGPRANPPRGDTPPGGYGLAAGERFTETFVLFEGDLGRARFNMAALVAVPAALASAGVLWVAWRVGQGVVRTALAAVRWACGRRRRAPGKGAGAANTDVKAE